MFLPLICGVGTPNGDTQRAGRKRALRMRQVVRSKHKVRSFAYCPARRKGSLVQLAVALTNNSFEVRNDQVPHPAKLSLCTTERGARGARSVHGKLLPELTIQECSITLSALHVNSLSNSYYRDAEAGVELCATPKSRQC